MRALTSADIKVNPLSLKDLFESSFYTIDFYQREYAWGESEVTTLVTDLRDAFDEWSNAREYRRKPELAPQYFLGPFVYYQQSDDVRSLVDGQQRFTTLHLIFLNLLVIGRQLEERQLVETLTPVIRKINHRRLPRYRVDIEERIKVLNAIWDDRPLEVSKGDSLSVRNLWERSQDIAPLLRDIPPESYAQFVEWLLNRVVMAGIRASDSNLAFRIFESMNDRGARLTSADLLKSYLIANAGRDEEKLNGKWRQMLTEITSVRSDRNDPGQFMKVALQARYARIGDAHDDITAIESGLNIWVRNNEALLHLDRGPDYYHSFIDKLLDLAAKYRALLHASYNLIEGLEEVFFNEKNGLSLQMVAIVAAIDPDETMTRTIDKAHKIAAFFDRWYVLRTLDESPTQQRDLLELTSDLLPALRKCGTPRDVSEALAQHIAADGQEPVTLDKFGLRGTNRHQVKYLLARLTSYAMKGCGNKGEVDDYLSEANPYQIEHLFANKPERHRKEVPDPLMFRSLRNQFGGLVLLPSSDNASFGAMPLDEKVVRYGRQNVLVGVLNKDYHLSFKRLRDFAKANGVESYLRPFNSKASMADIINVREKLYLGLCARIWSVTNIGIDVSSIPNFLDPFEPTESGSRQTTNTSKRSPRTDVARMVAANVLTPGTRIVLSHRGTDYWAEVCSDGTVKLEATGLIYSKVDDAGCVIRERQSCKGMNLWHVIDNAGNRISLADLRTSARKSGALPAARR